ncbi:hypothetical protein QN382_13310 [Pseudomonas sp. 10B1]|uniref:DUF2515 family protein n=1 Tax=unclassified Pseudomonas TaxID=196821 RepID=UPI002B23B593|nr:MULTISPECIES: hypothetical protein [unclassified Pseudomonas]MEA9994741.1 hypothetical protein [Pseudomonas sp. AA4]MEB0086404.1 hypothetical protein [Pseudomonas sp. RTI1]MEB0126397.1 hypothetical protein [Pseudomonas sp. CCC1.2]MEB0155236.1 hypothetical protein [Pseudomonas sp. CCC4.3]MEB0219738.1 hypothetical protein [Pseudomonas sp. AB12(2023)]
MTQCFKDHECDTQKLNQNTKPFSECKTHMVSAYDTTFECTDVPVLTCSGIWRVFQREAEEIVAPGGVLIADSIERNRAINAAYARLWLHDNRFQWAGLAAFASKQVGCGLLHAANTNEVIQAEVDAGRRMFDSGSDSSVGIKGLINIKTLDKHAMEDYEAASKNNPVPFSTLGGEPSLMQQQFRHVYDMMALGNTTLFLDIFPLHAFYKKRGLDELRICLGERAGIFGHPKFPVLWPVGQKKLEFGVRHGQILEGFAAIEKGNIAKSVELLAVHEQRNILQPTIYEDPQLKRLLRGNHASYVTGFPLGVAQAIELTLASQCHPVEDGRTLEFSSNPFADLSDYTQRIAFVMQAAARFDEMLGDGNRPLLEQSIRDIAEGSGVQ